MLALLGRTAPPVSRICMLLLTLGRLARCRRSLLMYARIGGEYLPHVYTIHPRLASMVRQSGSTSSRFQRRSTLHRFGSSCTSAGTVVSALARRSRYSSDRRPLILSGSVERLL